ncbi:MAG: hypothetical protein GC172_03840 [Phycisphaera sp.]|nr:hypothetical protein [Phycisphaera sp.]
MEFLDEILSSVSRRIAWEGRLIQRRTLEVVFAAGFALAAVCLAFVGVLLGLLALYLRVEADAGPVAATLATAALAFLVALAAAAGARAFIER